MFHDNLKYTQSEHNRQRTANEKNNDDVNQYMAQ